MKSTKAETPGGRSPERQAKAPPPRQASQPAESESAIVRQIIHLRYKRKMSQTDLAKRVGTPQPSIARMESRKQLKNLDYLQRIASALDARVEVRLVPLKRGARRHAKPGQGKRVGRGGPGKGWGG